MSLREHVLELVESARDKPDEFIVQLQIPCRRRPTGDRVRLWPRTGPWSAEGRSVAWGFGQATAWWTLGDLRATFEPREPTRAELLELLADIREVQAIDRDQLGAPVEVMLESLDAKLDRWPTGSK